MKHRASGVPYHEAMSAKSRRAVALVAVAFLLVAAGAGGALSDEQAGSYDHVRRGLRGLPGGVANERRFYMKDAQVAYARGPGARPQLRHGDAAAGRR